MDRSRWSAGAVVAGAVLIAVAQWWRSEPAVCWLLVWLAGVTAVAVATATAPTSPPVADAEASAAAAAPAAAPRDEVGILARWWTRERWATGACAALALGSGVVLWVAEQSRPPSSGRADLVALWLATNALVATLVHLPLAARRRRRVSYRELVTVAAVMAVALVVRTVALGNFPWVFNGDDAQFALMARAVLDGGIRDPFAVGWLAHPTMYPFVESLSLRWVGDSVIGARLPAALLGTVAVGVTYALARHHHRRAVAATAALFLAAFHWHVFWSRSAMNNVTDSVLVPLGILLLDRGLLHGRARSSLAAGTVTGLTAYGFPGGRVLVAIAVVLGLVAWLRPLTGSRRAVLGHVLLVGLGAVASALPFLAFAVDHPDDALARTRDVSALDAEWLDAERERTGRSTPEVFAAQVARAAMVPFGTDARGQYRGRAPFIGWAYAVPVAVGLAVVTTRAFRRDHVALAAGYWTAIAGLAMTVDADLPQRVFGLSSLLCVVAAIGVWRVAEALHVVGLPKAVTTGAACVAVAGACGWSLVSFFHDDNQVERWSDVNTQVAHHLAHETLAVEASSVWFSGTPRMPLNGFGNFLFITRVAAVDVGDEGLHPSDPAPELAGTTVFAALPERIDDLDVVRRWFPDGEHRVVRGEDGSVLYESWTVRR